MRLRTKYAEGVGWFAQVKKHLFSPWKTIGKHPNGYGLYPESHEDYPLQTEHLAEERCRIYEQHLHKKKNRTVNYNYL